jgi:hypothetical protein
MSSEVEEISSVCLVSSSLMHSAFQCCKQINNNNRVQHKQFSKAASYNHLLD